MGTNLPGAAWPRDLEKDVFTKRSNDVRVWRVGGADLQELLRDPTLEYAIMASSWEQQQQWQQQEKMRSISLT